MKRLVDLKELYELGDMSQEEYVDFCIDHMMYVMRYENGLLEIASASTLFFYDLATGEIETVEGHFSLPAKQWIVSVCKTVLPAVGALLAAAGLVLVIGSVMRWRVTIRSKLILTILPVVIIGFSVTTAAVLKQVENNYYETIHEEYEAVSELAVKQLDPELIASIDGIEDIENGNLEKLKKQVDEIFFSSDLDWSEEMIVNIFSYDESGVNRILFGTENRDSFFDYIYFTTIDKLEPERVGNTDTYVTTSHTGIEQYIDVVTLIRDENGKIIAMLDLSGYLDRYARTLYEIKKDIVMKSILLVSCLALLIFLITMYINRKLRKTTEVIQEISNGDFSVRVERLSRDELGIIGQGVNNMAMQIEKMFEEKDDFALQVIEALVGTIDAKDKYTNGHSLRVAKYSREIAKRLGKSEEEQLYVYYAGLLHDIGKIGIPDHIINKTSRLDDDEYARIKTHPVIGNEILSKLSSLQYISMGAYGHHERYDGKGYSQGLKGEEIPEIARIIGVADAYDAMTSNRSYRNAMSQEKVRREIEKGKGTQFDARFAEIMLELDTLYEKEIYGHF